MESDIHLSLIDEESLLSGIVKIMGILNPDIILLARRYWDDKAEVLEERTIV